MTPYVVGLIAFALVLFVFFPNRVKGFLNAGLAAYARWVEIRSADKKGKAPPHVHGLTVSGADEVRASDIQQAIKDAKHRRRNSKDKS